MWQLPQDRFLHDPPRKEMGELELGIALRDGKSVATRQYHTRALKVIRPHYLDDSGQVYYIIVNPGGGYVGGDAYRIDLDVDKNASMLITDQSAAKVYRTPDEYVVQNMNFSVAEGAVLEYIPDQLILYRDADFRQHITVKVHPTGSLFMSDIVTPGWSPDGEQFRYTQAHLRNVVEIDGETALVDNLRLCPQETEFDQNLDFAMGGRTHVATAICFDPAVDEGLLAAVRTVVGEHADADESMEAAITATERPGFVLRAIGKRTEELLALVLAVAGMVRATRGQGPINLRQY